MRSTRSSNDSARVPDPSILTPPAGQSRDLRAPPSLNVGEHSGRDSPLVEGVAEAGHHIGAGCVVAGVAAQTDPAVVIDDVQDRYFGAVGQLPMGEVGLPAFVGLIGAKRSPG